MQSILDGKAKETVLRVIALGGTRTLAAKYVGCHPRTIANAARADAAFSAKLNEMETVPEYGMVSTVTREGFKVPHVAKWGLERLYPDRYRPRQPSTFSIDTVKQIMVLLASRLMAAAESEAERHRALKIFTDVGKELIVESQPFLKEANAFFDELGDCFNETSNQPPAEGATPAKEFTQGAMTEVVAETPTEIAAPTQSSEITETPLSQESDHVE